MVDKLVAARHTAHRDRLNGAKLRKLPLAAVRLITGSRYLGGKKALRDDDLAVGDGDREEIYATTQDDANDVHSQLLSRLYCVCWCVVCACVRDVLHVDNVVTSLQAVWGAGCEDELVRTRGERAQYCGALKRSGLNDRCQRTGHTTQNNITKPHTQL